MSQSKPLSEKQASFARHYVANGFNGTQAAISAGYEQNSADVAAARLLGNDRVLAEIERLKAPIVKKTTMTAEKLALMVAEALEFDLTEWFDVLPDGRMILRCALSELPESVRKTMVQGFKQTKFGIEVNLVSKQFLIDTQARFLSMYKDQLTVKNEAEKLSDEELREALAELKGRSFESGNPDKE